MATLKAGVTDAGGNGGGGSGGGRSVSGGGAVVAAGLEMTPPPLAIASLSPPSSTPQVCQLSTFLPTDGDDDEGKRSDACKKKQLTLIPLIFIIFFDISGGPYGEEPAVQVAGPLLAILGFLVFPFVWSIPEALVTAELATAFPGNGGYVVWAAEAFGPFAGSMLGFWKYLSGVISNAAFTVLCVDYLSRLYSGFAGGTLRGAAVTAFTLALSFLNYTGLEVVGWATVVLGAASLAPFAVLVAAAAPRVRPARWLRGTGAEWKRRSRTEWGLYVNTLFWNLNTCDNASTLAGEVERPQRALPRALLGAGLLSCAGYLLPLLAATGALDVPQDQWSLGFLADAAGMIVGEWLKIWVEVGAILSTVGLFEAQLSTCSFQLLGMADLGLLPRVFASRSRWFHTPWLAITVSTAITLAASFTSFSSIITAANFLYSLGMLLEFASFLWLRWKRPGLQRPFRVPLRTPGLVCMYLIPSGFLLFVMMVASWQVYAISASLTALGIAFYYAMKFCESRGWFEFTNQDEGEREKVEEEETDECPGVVGVVEIEKVIGIGV